MTVKAGAAIPVRQSTEAPQGGPAIPVYGYTAAPGDRPAMGGAAQPVYVLTAAQLRANGGEFNLVGDPQAIPVYDAPPGSPVQGGKPIPVYPVNAWPGGNLSYMQRVTNLVGAASLLRLWMQDEAAGTTITDYSPNHANKALAYVSVTLGQPGPIAGHTAAQYDGATSYADVLDLPLANSFNLFSECTIFAWARVTNAAVWTDGSNRAMFGFGDAGVNNDQALYKSDPNAIGSQYIGGGVGDWQTLAYTSNNWMLTALRVSTIANQISIYADGNVASFPLAAAWGGVAMAIAVLGAANTGPGLPFSGWLGPTGIVTRALLTAELDLLAAIRN